MFSFILIYLINQQAQFKTTDDTKGGNLHAQIDSTIVNSAHNSRQNVKEM